MATIRAADSANPMAKEPKAYVIAVDMKPISGLEKLALLMSMKLRFMFDYSALAAIGAVIREGSFERAASRLGITPSAISQRVRGLEERLGTILIVRGQPCEPTELGRKLCAHLDKVQLLEADVVPLLAKRATGATP